MRWSLILSAFLLFSAGQAAAQCSIVDVVVEATACENGLFFVHIDFEVINPGGDQFGVLGNATNYGLFLYEDLPIELGPLEGDGETNWEFIIYDLEDPECQVVEELGVVSCCSIEITTAEALECNGMNAYSVLLDLDTMNTFNVGFDVFDAENNHIGFYPYSALPVTIPEFPASGNSFDLIKVCDNDNPGCCDVYEIEALDCDTTDCEIYDLTVDTTACELGEFFVILDFEYENVSPFFVVVGNGNNYGTFEYSDLPIMLGPFLGDGETVYEFGVSDFVFDNCGAAIALDPIACPEVCGFQEIVVEPTECQGDSAYSLDLDFIPVFTSDFFTVSAGGVVLDTFAYEELPVTIDSFPASGNFFDALTICDLEDAECCSTVEFIALQCGSCLIYNLDAFLSPCDTNDAFTIEISFSYINTSDSFFVSGNGNVYGTFGYNELPVVIGPFPADSTTFYEIAVIDDEDIFCFAGEEIGLVDCETICGFSDIVADPLECTGDNQYALLLDFEVDGTNQSFFDLYVNGSFFGFFEYANLPITILEFPSSGSGLDTITICDNDNPDCCETYVFEGLDCEVECSIFDLVVDIGDCNSDSTHTLFVNFEYEGVDAGGFDVFGNGEYLGFFPLEPLPLVIENFPVNPEGNSVVTVCQSDDDMCCASLEFEGPDCAAACEIYEVVAEAGDCTSDSTYALFLNFLYEGVSNPFFDVYSGDDFVAFIAGDSLPVTIDNFPAPENGISVITICENDNPDCCTTVEIEAPNCGPVACSINDLDMDFLECTSDSTYAAIIDFNWQGVTNNGFDIWANDVFLGYVDADSVPVTFTEIPSPESGNIAVITVCENDNPECCSTIEVEVADCDSDACAIFDLTADPTECTSANSFGLLISFEYQNLGADGFDYYGDGEYLGYFPVTNIPDIISFPVSGNPVSVLTICRSDDTVCCASVEFEPLECSDDCIINEITVDPTECTSDSTYNLWVNFNYQNTGTDSFDVYAGDDYITTINGENLPVLIEGFPSSPGIDHITICAFENPECCKTKEFEGLNCGGGNCEIGELMVEIGDCNDDGFFFVTINFEYANVGENGFTVAGNGNQYGTFNYEDLPIIIDGLVGDGKTNYEFVVHDVDFGDCASDIGIGTVDCGAMGNCEIGELMVDIGECNDDGFFSVTINFEYANVGENGFTVAGNGNQYGTFSYEDLPIVIDGLVGDGETNYEFVVHDVDFGDCASDIGIGTVDCGAMGNCEIGEILVDFGSCNDDGLFYVTITFAYANVGNDGFTLTGNGNQYGTFSYENLPITIEGLVGDGITVYEFVVTDVQFGDCSNAVEFGTIDCENMGLCEIGELDVTIGDCNDDGLFFVTIDFDYANVGNNGFTVAGNGNQYGTFSYENLPIVIDGLMGDSMTFYEFVVHDVDFGDCSSDIGIGLVDCSPNGVFEPGFEILALRIYYSTSSAFVVIPEEGMTMRIFNSMGMQVFEQTGLHRDKVIEFEANALPQGIYMVQVGNDNRLYTGKMLLR